MITDQMAEKALDYIKDNAKAYAVAKSQSVQLDHYRKIVRSKLFRDAAGTVAEREAWAECHHEYKAAVDAMTAAIEEEARLKWMLVAAQEQLNVYRTMSANERKATS